MTAAYEGWAIVEIMGHRRIAGRVSEVEMYGTRMLRVDVPAGGDDPAGVDYVTQFYSGSAIYCVTPATEETARKASAACESVQPIKTWEMPALGVGKTDPDGVWEDEGAPDVDEDDDGVSW